MYQSYMQIPNGNSEGPDSSKKMSGEASSENRLFYTMLSQLGDQHENEVNHLHGKIDLLRAVLKKESIVDPTIWNEDEMPWTSVSKNASPRVEASDRLSSLPTQAKPDGALESASGTALAKDARFEDVSANEDNKEFCSTTFGVSEYWKQYPTAAESIVADPDKETVSSHALAMQETVRLPDLLKLGSSSTLTSSKPNGCRSFCHGMRRLRCIPRHKLINPGQPSRVMWDLAGMFLISYDMISLPVVFCFNPGPNTLTDVMGWVTLCFWTMDMFTSIVTGFYSDGKLVMDQQAIILNYLKGWFWVDCIVVLPDWVMKAMGSVTNVAGLGRILRIARIMRVLRLLRLLKLKKVFALVYDYIDSESMFIVVNLIQLITVILVMNHLIACLWYLVGRVYSDSGTRPNWLEDTGATPVIDESLEWKYLTALHWSITQFTPASMDVSATNEGERLFSIVILFWALVALSSIIGSVSASMTALRNLSSDENKQFWVLRRYLRQRKIERQLTQRIIKYLEFQAVSKHNSVSQGSVTLLTTLSEQFKIELAHQLSKPVICNHPFFKYLEGEMIHMMYRICHGALQSHVFALHEVAFNPGDEGLRMYFIKSGIFEYRMVDKERIDVDIKPKFWAAEASLWTNWRHRGTLTAKHPSEVMGLQPQKFSSIFMLHPRPWYLARNYALAFVAYLNQLDVKARSDVVFNQNDWTHMVKGSDTFELTSLSGDRRIRRAESGMLENDFGVGASGVGATAPDGATGASGVGASTVDIDTEDGRKYYCRSL